MKVVDVDAHVFEPFTWLKDTNPALDEDLGLIPSFLDSMFGELLAGLPADKAKEYRSAKGGDFLIREDGTPLTSEEAQHRLENSDRARYFIDPLGALNADDRITANDQQGIDIQFIHPTIVLAMLNSVCLDRPDRYQDYCEAYNTWVMGVYEGHTDRLIPSALVDFADPQRAVDELTRMRNLGSRQFLLPMRPVAGKPPSHPDHDSIWDAAMDLGMIPVMHVTAAGPKYDTEWLNTGRGNDGALFWRIGMMYTPTVPMLAMTDLIFNGLFDRHPEMTVLCAEFGIDWVLGYMTKLDDARQASEGLNLQMAPTDYIRRNIRFSPLPSGDLSKNEAERVDRFVDMFGPEMLWFAGDYPHPEGSAHAVAEFDAQLNGHIDEQQRERFFGGAVLEVLNRGA